MPERIQRQRTKGWRMPEGAVYVGRPSIWGNPWKVTGLKIIGPGGFFCHPEHRVDAHHFAVHLYMQWLQLGLKAPALMAGFAMHRPLMERRERILDELSTLRGYDLACWCAPTLACHASVLLELANREAPS